ncbi:putative arginyl-tRNA--protein transferase [Betaproteobacteria bacterium]|nr:putative arginyl-tRNA--protein transferase [Betaproteobacteria bacterium]
MHQNDLHPLRFFVTEAYPCSYLAGHMARSQVQEPMNDSATTQRYSAMVRRGFRRSGPLTYRPCCDLCHACIPVRLPVDLFIPDRSQRRAERRHAGLVATVHPPAFSPEHFELYQRYQRARHRDGTMEHDNPEQYRQFLLASPIPETRLVEFREQGHLRMVSVIDPLADGISSVYTFFDPDLPGASLGTYGVLWQIEACRQLQLPYLYLGYWISASRKMSYKARFQPLEAYSGGGQWKSLALNETRQIQNP